MANPNAGFGLRPARLITGAAPNYQLTPIRIAYNESSTIAKGDPIILDANGNIDIWASGAIYGVFWGCTYLNPSVGNTVWVNTWNAPTLPSGTVVTAYIITDRDMIWEVVAPSATNVGYADIGQNATLTGMSTPSPSNANGMSTARLGTLGTTNTYPLTITGLSQIVGFDNTAVNNVVEVKFNNTFWVAGVTGV